MENEDTSMEDADVLDIQMLDNEDSAMDELREIEEEHERLVEQCRQLSVLLDAVGEVPLDDSDYNHEDNAIDADLDEEHSDSNAEIDVSSKRKNKRKK